MKRGFTLVELSIVLVIIGLLIGGVLAAQTMVGASKLQSTIRTIEQFEISARNFNNSFKSIPGDSDKFSPQGNNNNVIETHSHMYQFLTGWQESLNFFRHLTLAGYTKENFIVYTGSNNFNGDFTGLAPKLAMGEKCYLTPYTMAAAQSNKDLGNSWAIAAGTTDGITKCLRHFG